MWRIDPWTKNFSGVGIGIHRVCVPEDVAVVDARMNANGALDVWCVDGSHLTYLCDDDVLMAQGKWGPLLCLYELPCDRRFSWEWYLEACKEAAPDITGMLLCGSVRYLELWSLPAEFREVRFASDYASVGSWRFYGVGLERVVLCAGVQEVEDGAFAYNPALREFVIEGDVSRIAGWAANAFEGCPCEDEYSELRRKFQADFASNTKAGPEGPAST